MSSVIRWHLKKAARAGMALSALANVPEPLPGAAQRNRVIRVLTYHRFGPEVQDPFCINPKIFEKQMDYLACRGVAVSLEDLHKFVTGEASLPPNAVLVTVDDGFRSLYTKALPILRHFGIPAVAFVTASLLAGDQGSNRQVSSAQAPEEYLRWDELARLADFGVTVGSHAWTHRSLGRMPMLEAYEEAIRSRETLEERIGNPVKAFAYPFGTLADFNTTTGEILKRTGYEYAFTSQHGAVRPRLDPFSLPRVKVEGGEGLWLFRQLVRGGLDAWRWVDKTLWRIQASGA